jgi:hypothetical protein
LGAHRVDTRSELRLAHEHPDGTPLRAQCRTLRLRSLDVELGRLEPERVS